MKKLTDFIDRNIGFSCLVMFYLFMFMLFVLVFASIDYKGKNEELVQENQSCKQILLKEQSDNKSLKLEIEYLAEQIEELKKVK